MLLPGLRRSCAARVLVDDRHRAAAAVVLGRGRLVRFGDADRRSVRADLRAANERRPDRVRRSRRALPLRIAGSVTVRPRPARVPRARGRAARPLPLPRQRRDHAPMGWAAGDRPRLVPVGDVRPADRHGRRRRLRRATVSRRATSRVARSRSSSPACTPRGPSLAWVDHESPEWEREPLRWMGVNAGLALAKAADRREARTGRPARVLGRAAPHAHAGTDEQYCHVAIGQRGSPANVGGP